MERRKEGQRPWKKGVSDARVISVRAKKKEQWITKTSVLPHLFSFLLDLLCLLFCSPSGPLFTIASSFPFLIVSVSFTLFPYLSLLRCLLSSSSS